MSDPPDPLEPRLLELLREEPPAPSDARMRARARLAIAIPGIGGGAGAGGSGGGHAGGSVGGGAVRAASGVVGSHGVAVVAFLLGGAAGAGLHAALTAPPAPRIVYVTPSAMPAVSPPPAAAVPSASATGAASAMAPESAAPVASPAPSAPHVSQLDGERSRLDEVRAALVQGDPDRALERLRASRHEFPHAVLAEERDALTVEALIGAHHDDEGRAAASAFRERYPNSLFAGAVEAAVRSIP